MPTVLDPTPMEYERAKAPPTGVDGKWVVAALLAIIVASIAGFLCFFVPILLWRG